MLLMLQTIGGTNRVHSTMKSAGSNEKLLPIRLMFTGFCFFKFGVYGSPFMMALQL